MLKCLSFINEIKVRFLFFNPLKLDKVCHGARRSFDICSQEDASCLTYEKFLKNARPGLRSFIIISDPVPYFWHCSDPHFIPSRGRIHFTCGDVRGIWREAANTEAVAGWGEESGQY